MADEALATVAETIAAAQRKIEDAKTRVEKINGDPTLPTLP